MKVRCSIEGAGATVPRRVKAFGKEGTIEVAAVCNGATSFGIALVEGKVTLHPGGTTSTPEDALARYGRVDADEPGPPSPFKGSWKAAMGMVDGRPLLELRRKMTAYAAVLVRWDGKTWSWEVTREERWFAKGRAKDQGAADSMARAIHTAVASLDKHVRDACVVQHLQKRTAHDPAWAATHPDRPERPVKEVPVPGVPKPPRAARAPKATGAHKEHHAGCGCALPTSTPPPPRQPRRPRGETVVPARTDDERAADARYGPLTVTPLFPSADDTGQEDKDAALMKLFASAVDQALAGVTP